MSCFFTDFFLELQQAMLVELSTILLEMDCRCPPVASPFYKAVRSSPIPDPSKLRDHLSHLSKLPRHQFNIGVHAAASALSSVFHLPLGVSRLAASRRALAQMSSIRPSAQISHVPENASQSPSEFPTADDLLSLRSCVCRLLGSIDLSAMDSQPVCRSLIRCLEFLVRDPIILLLSLGVPEVQLMEGLMKVALRQRPTTETTRPSSCISAEPITAAPIDSTSLPLGIETEGYDEHTDRLIPAVLAAVHGETLGGGFSIGIPGGSESRPLTEAEEENEVIDDDDDDDESDDEDEESSGPDDTDMMMDEGEDVSRIPKIISK